MTLTDKDIQKAKRRVLFRAHIHSVYDWFNEEDKEHRLILLGFLMLSTIFIAGLTTWIFGLAFWNLWTRLGLIMMADAACVTFVSVTAVLVIEEARL